MAFHAPEEESLDAIGLAELQDRKLRLMLEAVAKTNPFWRGRFEEVRFDATSDPLNKLPLLTRGDLEADQAAHPPYGSNMTYPLDHYPRLHQTSGSTGGTPLRLLDTKKSWDWWKHCWAVIYRAAGITDDDRFFLPFSFGPFIGFWGAFESATALENFCLPAGGMSTSARLRYMLDHGATIVCCTPTYALRMSEVAAQDCLDLRQSRVRALIVAGEPGGHLPAVRSRIEDVWGARVFDHAGMTEVGPWGFECLEDPTGLHVMESEFIAEVIDPKTGETVEGEGVGELVLTSLGRWGTPVIRYRTGDQVSLIRGRCACGRWFARAVGGILGRTDDMLYIRGNNVFPSSIEDLMRSLAGVAEFQVEVATRSSMTELKITVEPEAGASGDEVTAQVRNAIRNRFHFDPTVTAAAQGSLPRYEMKARRFVRTDHT